MRNSFHGKSRQSKGMFLRCALSLGLVVMSAVPAFAGLSIMGDEESGQQFYLIDGQASVPVANRLAILYSYDFGRGGDMSVLPYFDAGSSGISVYPVVDLMLNGNGYREFSGLTSLVIPDSVLQIDTVLFAGSLSLTNVVIGAGVREISGAFSNCSNLRTVTLGSHVKTIDRGAFRGCTNLTEITFPRTLTHLGSMAFKDCTGLTEIELPEGLTHIGASAFQGCTSITSVTLPKSLKSIGADAFKDCSALVSVTGDCDLEEYASAFDGTPFYDGKSDPTSPFVKVGSCLIRHRGKIQLKTHAPGTDAEEEYVDWFDIPDGVTMIADDVFRSTWQVKPSEYGQGRLGLPDSLRHIGKRAFERCGWIKTVSGGTNVSFVGEAAFDGTLYTGRGFKDDVLYAYEGAATYSTFRQVKLGSVLVAVKGPWPSNVVIADGVRRIGPGVFAKDSYRTRFRSATDFEPLVTSSWMRKLTLPDSLELLDENAFSDASLENLETLVGGENLHDFSMNGGLGPKNHPFARVDNPLRQSLEEAGGLLTLGDTVFGWFGAWPETMTIPEGVAVVADGAFSSELPDKHADALRHVTLPSTLRHLGKSAFSGQRSLETVRLPEGVEFVGRHAFAYCTNIVELTFPSTLKGVGCAIVYNGASTSIGHRPAVTNITFLGNAPKRVDDSEKSEGLTHPLSSQGGGTIFVREGSVGWCYENCGVIPDTWPSLITGPEWSVRLLPDMTFEKLEGAGGARLLSVRDVRPVMDLPSKSTEYGSVLGIGPRVFGENAATVRELTVPSSVREISRDAFAGCTSLSRVHVFADAESEVRAALTGSGLDVAKITLVVSYLKCEDDGSGTGVVVTGLAESFAGGHLDIPSEIGGKRVSILDYSVFEMNSSIKSVSLPDGLYRILDNAFFACDITSITFGAGIEAIGRDAFRYCYALKTVRVPPAKLEFVRDALTASGLKVSGITFLTEWDDPAATTCRVEFRAGDGTGTMDPLQMDPARVDRLPACTLTEPPDGRHFAGWACSNGRRYDDGILVFGLGKPGQTVIMTAIWE